MSSIFEPIRSKIFSQSRTMVSGWLEDKQVPDRLKLGSMPFDAEKCYVNIVLNSMHIVYDRIGFQRLCGVVHSFIKMPVYAVEEAQFNVVTTPLDLANVEGNRLDKVIQGNKELLDCIPYRGGTIKIQLGLFAVKAEDMLPKYLSLLGELADAAGVNYVRQAVPFLNPITKGIELLLGTAGSSNMIVGRQESMTPMAGYYVITNEPTENPSRLEELKIDKNYRLLNTDGTPYKSAYMIFSVYPTPNRQTWFDIPELGTAFANLRLAVRSGTKEAIKQAYDIFEKEAQSSPDLIKGDYEKIVKEVRAQYVDQPPLEMIKTPPTINPPTRSRRGSSAPTVQPPMNDPWIVRTLSKEDKKAAENLKVFA